MAVVTSTFFTSGAANWITSPTWTSSDPSFKLNTQLTDWVTAINDSSKINIQQTPNNATTKTLTNFVTWPLQCRDGETTTDFGIMFHGRHAGQTNVGSGTYSGAYYIRVAGTGNNNYGSYSSIGDTQANEDLTVAHNFFTAYEATGSTPWFVYSAENIAKTARVTRALFRLDTTGLEAGSYYPSTGISKWLYVMGRNDVFPVGYDPIANIALPAKGITTASRAVRAPIPVATNGNGYFFRAGSQYGDAHYLGNITNDLLFSNTSTGVWGDTIVIGSSTYTCLGTHSTANLWIKTL